jgi:DNA helicase II / ATP-dependent DNA helicase PcrA
LRIEITDDDIAYAENLLLPDGAVFNEERRAFIRCMDSRDVVACPGSGKTTTLLAKLLILAKKMPFEDGRGICVLTHTNVAIEEIKKRAKISSESLFRYPHFFGTIHSFVGTYLAIPAYIDLFGHRDVRIDDELYRMQSSIVFNKHGLERNKAIYFQLKERLKGMNWPAQKIIKQEFFNDLEFKFEDGYVSYCQSKRTVVKGQKIPSESYGPIHSAKYDLLKRGYLRYQDVFSLGELHVYNNKNIGALFQNRFSFLFVDEMQDSDESQVKILDSVFPQDSEIIIQRIGDPNQAIYHDISNNKGIWKPRSPIHFSDSRRYGKTITHILSTVRLNEDVTLQPYESRESLPPYLITYQDGEEQTVIRAFSGLIQILSLPSEGIYKALGWVGRDRTSDYRLCIPTYYPDFDRLHKVQNKYFSNLISYAAYAIQIANAEGPKRFLEIVMQGCAHALDVAGIKDEISDREYSPTTFKHFWKHNHETSYYEFRENMAELFRRALDSSTSPLELRDQIKSAMQPIWATTLKTTDFLNDDSIDATSEASNEAAQAKNQFVADNGIVIHIGTVHSAKGETHTATLYMETEYQTKTDATRLINFLKGNRNKAELGKARHQQNLNIAHVAFSRPTQLLAFACRASSISGHEDGLIKNSWVIITAAELNKKT